MKKLEYESLNSGHIVNKTESNKAHIYREMTKTAGTMKLEMGKILMDTKWKNMEITQRMTRLVHMH